MILKSVKMICVPCFIVMVYAYCVFLVTVENFRPLVNESLEDTGAKLQMVFAQPDIYLSSSSITDTNIDNNNNRNDNETMKNSETENKMMDIMMENNDDFFKPNPDVPLLIPLVEGYHNGTKVYFIHTEISDKNMANMMTNMINYPTIYVPNLKNLSDANLSKVYVFTNGIAGSGPYGGGPFMYQIDIFDSLLGSEGHSGLRSPYLVSWNENTTARLLTSINDLVEAMENDELEIKKAPDNMTVNAPIIAWKNNNGEVKTVDEVEKVFESMPNYTGKVEYVDVDNYTVKLKLIQTQ